MKIEDLRRATTCLEKLEVCKKQLSLIKKHTKGDTHVQVIVLPDTDKEMYIDVPLASVITPFEEKIKGIKETLKSMGAEFRE